MGSYGMLSAKEIVLLFVYELFCIGTQAPGSIQISFDIFQFQLERVEREVDVADEGDQ